jgi:hypothetical protein
MNLKLLNVILVVVCVALVLVIWKESEKINDQTLVISEQKAAIATLQVTIANEKQVRSKEAEERKHLDDKYRAQTLALYSAKHKDSLIAIRTIKSLKDKYASLTDAEIDSTLTAEYAKSTGEDKPDLVNKDVKIWTLAINDQNKDLGNKLILKDKIIDIQDSIGLTLRGKIASYQRDSVSWERTESAYRESVMRSDTIIQSQEKVIKSTRRQRNIAIAGAAIAILLSLL